MFFFRESRGTSATYLARNVPCDKEEAAGCLNNLPSDEHSPHSWVFLGVGRLPAPGKCSWYCSFYVYYVTWDLLARLPFKLSGGNRKPFGMMWFFSVCIVITVVISAVKSVVVLSLDVGITLISPEPVLGWLHNLVAANFSLNFGNITVILVAGDSFMKVVKMLIQQTVKPRHR